MILIALLHKFVGTLHHVTVAREEEDSLGTDLCHLIAEPCDIGVEKGAKILTAKVVIGSQVGWRGYGDVGCCCVWGTHGRIFWGKICGEKKI